MSESNPLTQAESEAQVEALREAIQAIAEKCDFLVDQVARGEISQEDFYVCLRETGITPEAAKDYIEQMVQRVEQQGCRDHRPPILCHTSPAPIHRQPTPDGLDDDALLDFRTRRKALLQATLQAKIAQLQTSTIHTIPTATPSCSEDPMPTILQLLLHHISLALMVLQRMNHT
jgi:hypothetical protein